MAGLSVYLSDLLLVCGSIYLSDWLTNCLSICLTVRVSFCVQRMVTWPLVRRQNKNSWIVAAGHFEISVNRTIRAAKMIKEDSPLHPMRRVDVMRHDDASARMGLRRCKENLKMEFITTSIRERWETAGCVRAKARVSLPLMCQHITQHIITQYHYSIHPFIPKEILSCPVLFCSVEVQICLWVSLSPSALLLSLQHHSDIMHMAAFASIETKEGPAWGHD